MDKEDLHSGVTDTVIRISRECTEDVEGGLAVEALSPQSPRDSGVGSSTGKLGRKPAGDHCKATELESVKTKGCMGSSGAIQQEHAKRNSCNQEGILCRVRKFGLYSLGKRESLGELEKEQRSSLLISQGKYDRNLD